MANHIEDYLEDPFRKIEKIISMAHNPIEIHQIIAERFAFALPEEIYERISDCVNRGKKRSSEGSVVTSPSTPIMDSEVVHKKTKRFLIKYLI